MQPQGEFAMSRCVCYALFFALVASWADASTIHFRYDGKPFSCFGDEECIDEHHGTSDLPPFQANLSLDEKLYPGGRLANSELTLFSIVEDSDLEDGDGPGYRSTIGYSLRSANIVYKSSVQKDPAVNQEFSDYSQFSFVEFDGIMRDALEASVGGIAYFRFLFDDRGHVSSWVGSSGLQGASAWDWSTSPSGDYYGDGLHSIGLGRWVRLTPVPVPLPLSALLYASGIALLGALGLCRKRRHREPAPS
jgi:hypothetical protein